MADLAGESMAVTLTFEQLSDICGVMRNAHDAAIRASRLDLSTRYGNIAFAVNAQVEAALGGAE